MQHFPIEDWADFARNVASEEQKARLQQHLDQGCSHCMKAAKGWASVTESAKRELSYEPPASSLNIARAFFSAYRSTLNQASRFRIAMLAFDSFQRAFVGGIRSGEQVPRQLMYNCDDVVIDLQVISKASSRQITLMGQVASELGDGFPPDGLCLSVIRDDETLHEATLNEFGEFHITLPFADNLQLRIPIKGDTVVLHLPDSVGGMHAM